MRDGRAVGRLRVHARSPHRRVVRFDLHGTGVLIRLATEQEALALAKARRTHDLELDPPRSDQCSPPPTLPESHETYVVGQAFVEFTDGTGL